MTPAEPRLSEPFLGIPFLERTAGPFSYAHWVATAGGALVAEHEHRAAHFMFIVSGEFVTDASRGTGSLRLVYNPSGTVHRDHFARANGSFFSVTLQDSAVSDVTGDLPRRPRVIQADEADGRIMRLLRECSEWEEKDSPSIVEDLTFELMESVAVPESASRAPRWLPAAMSALDSSADDRVPVHELSRILGVHRGHLTRVFRRHLGCTPAEFSRMRRLRAAAHLLATTRMPVADVALETAFADQSHFTKHFSRCFGVAPARYRTLTT